MSRVRVAYTAGEAVGPEIFNFYRSLGVNMKQLYGQTEASVFVTIHPNGEVFSDTVGKPVSEVELRIAESGEVLYRSPGVFKEYFKNPQATNDTKTADGWVHTGDAGYLDERGHLRIIDRAKDVGKLNDGTLFAPKFIENKLKFFPHINEAVAFGHGRDFVAAFVNIDMTAVGDWAERRNIAYASYQELAAHPDGLRPVAGRDRAGQPRPRRRSAHGGRADPPLPDPAQGARGRRRRAHAHQQGAPRLHRRALQRAGRRALRRRARTRTSRSTSPSRTAARARSRATSTIRDLAPPPARGAAAGRRAEPRWRGRARPFNEVLLVGREHQPVVRRREGADATSASTSRKGEIRAIIGPNGAGKSSMLNCINGFYHPQQGAITYKGVQRSRMRPHEAAEQGIAPHLPEHRAVPRHDRRSTTS